MLLGLVVAACGRAPAPEVERSTPAPAPAAIERPPVHEATQRSDAALGASIQAFSEATGEFPSDNLVSNETSYLDVAPALEAPALRDRAYVGVGPEQNLTYLALLRPRLAYLVDIRRGNLLEHLVLRAAIEPSETPEAFLATLTARPEPAADALDGVLAALRRTTAAPALLTAARSRTRALCRRLGLSLTDQDEAVLDAIHQAFAAHGADLTYSMDGSRRRYPTLASLLAARDPSGRQASFVADREAYARVRSLLRENGSSPWLVTSRARTRWRRWRRTSARTD
jgi:hypothetical protein